MMVWRVTGGMEHNALMRDRSCAIGLIDGGGFLTCIAGASGQISLIFSSKACPFKRTHSLNREDFACICKLCM